MNQIYLGQRAYGFGSASQTYFGKPLKDLSVGEAATLAGLPVAPSAYNPVVNNRRATMRRNYVLGRMATLGFISEQTSQQEQAKPVYVKDAIAEAIASWFTTSSRMTPTRAVSTSTSRSIRMIRRPLITRSVRTALLLTAPTVTAALRPR